MLNFWKRARNSRALAARKCTELFNTLGATGTLQFQHAPEVEVIVRGGRLYIVAPLDSEEFRELLNKEAEYLTANSVEAVAVLNFWKRARNSRALAARKCTELFNTLGATGTLQFQHAPEVEVLVRGGRLYIVAPLDSEEFRELLNKEAEHLVSNSVEAVASTAKAVLERPDALEELLEETPRPYVFQRLTEEA